MWENLAFLNAVGLRDHITWNYPSWSIGAEFLTYLVFGVCVCFAARRLAVVAAGLSITGLLLVILVAADRPGPTIDVTYSFGFFRCLYGFFLGHLVYRAWKTTPCRLGSAGEVAVTLAVVAFVQFVGDGFSTILAPVVFAAAVWVFAAEGGVLTRALKTTLIQKLGLWSYGIYMTHTLVLLGLDKMIGFSEKRLNLDISYLETMSNIGKPLLLPLIGNAWVMDLLALIYLAAVVALGALAYRYVEVPGQAFILDLRPAAFSDERHASAGRPAVIGRFRCSLPECRRDADARRCRSCPFRHRRRVISFRHPVLRETHAGACAVNRYRIVILHLLFGDHQVGHDEFCRLRAPEHMLAALSFFPLKS